MKLNLIVMYYLSVFRFAGLVWHDSHRRVGVDAHAAQSMLIQTVLFEVSKYDQVSRTSVVRER